MWCLARAAPWTEPQRSPHPSSWWVHPLRWNEAWSRTCSNGNCFYVFFPSKTWQRSETNKQNYWQKNTGIITVYMHAMISFCRHAFLAGRYLGIKIYSSAGQATRVAPRCSWHTRNTQDARKRNAGMFPLHSAFNIWWPLLWFAADRFVQSNRQIYSQPQTSHWRVTWRPKTISPGELCQLPSGKLTQLWKITILMGKSTINGHFQ